jgi:hypothetical protein
MDKQCLSKQQTTNQVGANNGFFHLLDIGGLCEIVEIVSNIKKRVYALDNSKDTDMSRYMEKPAERDMTLPNN